MKAALERPLATLAWRTGLLAGAGSAWRTWRRLAGDGRAYQVLNYHRVHPRRDPFFLHAVHPRDFDRQLGILRRHYAVFPLRELLRRAAEGSLPPHAVALTFDDGYADNHAYALPLLRKWGLPATLFLATGCLDQGYPLWYDKVFLAFKATHRPRLDLPGRGWGGLPLGNVPERLRAMSLVLDGLRAAPDPERLAALDELFPALGVRDFSSLDGRMLTWDQARELDAAGFAVEAHSVSHPILSRLGPEALEAEIRGCKAAIEARLQKEVTLFAYPNGKPADYGPAVSAALARAGFTHAFTTVFGRNRADTPPFELRRAAPWHDDPARFALGQLKIQLGT